MNERRGLINKCRSPLKYVEYSAVHFEKHHYLWYTPESWYALQKEKILVVKVSK